MPPTRQDLEVLAPAGNWELLLAALDAGADAVYIGLKGMSARPNPWGFDLHEAQEACKTVHAAGRRVYFALNAEYSEFHANQFLDAIQALDGVADAFIIGDWGLLDRGSKMGLKTPLQSSTLLGVYNYQTARFLKELGVSRIILNTNLYLDEIAGITLGCPEMRYEIIAYGGVCFNDNNRCRLPHFNIHDKYLVGCGLDYQIFRGGSGETAPKPGSIHMPDIDLSSTLQVYTELGITSFKIEGRTRPQSYLRESIGALRRAIENTLDQPNRGRLFHYLADLSQARRQR